MDTGSLDAHRPTDTALRLRVRQAHPSDCLSSSRWAWNCPSATSFKMILSKVSSATAFLRRAFSDYNSFIRFAWSIRKPPWVLRHRK